MNARRSLIALLACTLATPAAAQRGRNFEDAVPRAKAMAERVDTAGALALLDSAVRARPRDASAWHLRGLILMETTRPAVRKGFFTDQATISRLRAADSSIKLATLYAPDSGRFELTLGRLLLFGNFIWLRAGAPEHFEKALVKARRVGDRPLMAELEDELGMVRWRAYESVANRHELFDTPSPDALLANNQLIAELLANHATEYDPPLGELDYRRAVDHFTQALTADPRNARAARHLFMALAERGGWEELRRAADVRTATVPDDPYAWLARGLAQFRLGDQRAAAAAFDGALARMSPAERARYSDVGRLMRPADSTTYAALDAAGRAEAERVYWAFVDPMTLTPENEHRLEFLSRVAHAELRWTSDDLYLKGADTDRGQVWVRYGPPDRIASFPAPTTRPEMPTTIWHYVLPGR
jgi:GWxTD domain-containing protein